MQCNKHYLRLSCDATSRKTCLRLKRTNYEEKALEALFLNCLFCSLKNVLVALKIYFTTLLDRYIMDN